MKGRLVQPTFEFQVLAQQALGVLDHPAGVGGFQALEHSQLRLAAELQREQVLRVLANPIEQVPGSKRGQNSRPVGVIPSAVGLEADPVGACRIAAGG